MDKIVEQPSERAMDCADRILTESGQSYIVPTLYWTTKFAYIVDAALEAERASLVEALTQISEIGLEAQADAVKKLVELSEIAQKAVANEETLQKWPCLIEKVFSKLVDIIGNWNDAGNDHERGRYNDAIVVVLYDDGSGRLGKAVDPEGINIQTYFDNPSQLAEFLKDWANNV